MSFLHSEGPTISLKIKQGYSFGPRTFLKRHGASYDPPHESFENDGFEAQLEVVCTVGGLSVFTVNTEDSGSGLTIDPDEILVSFELSPSQTAELETMCCDFVLFIYKGDIDDPDEKHPLASGEFIVEVYGGSEESS